MPETITCKHCGKEKPANLRLKGNQKYCSDPTCQRARKAAWQREKKAKDAEYRASQNECVKNWRKNKPAHRYQRQYRQEHPEYVIDNCNKQRIRNQKRRARTTKEKIVKMDALENQLEQSKVYIMTPYEMDASGKIVKMDTLFVELKAFQGDRHTFFSSFP